MTVSLLHTMTVTVLWIASFLFIINSLLVQDNYMNVTTSALTDIFLRGALCNGTEKC